MFSLLTDTRAGTLVTAWVSGFFANEYESSVLFLIILFSPDSTIPLGCIRLLLCHPGSLKCVDAYPLCLVSILSLRSLSGR